jgi:hypothetical protein
MMMMMMMVMMMLLFSLGSRSEMAFGLLVSVLLSVV